MEKEKITYADFNKIDLKVGTILQAEIFKEAKKPAYKLWIDFGDLGTKKSSAQITALYQPEELIGKQIIAVVNFEPKQIANFMSECLVLGVLGDDNEVTLLSVDLAVKNGCSIA
jgi:tRNA-binding protein